MNAPGDLVVHELQQRLLTDPIAPSAVVPRWDSPWHDSQWLDLQTQGSPSDQLRSTSAQCTGQHARRFEGVLTVAADGAASLQLADGVSWPLITLEPEIAAWWDGVDGAIEACVMARMNPWGPWLVVEQRYCC